MINYKLNKKREEVFEYYLLEYSVLIFLFFYLIFFKFYSLILDLFFIELSHSRNTDHEFKRLTRFGRLTMLAQVFFN